MKVWLLFQHQPMSHFHVVLDAAGRRCLKEEVQTHSRAWLAFVCYLDARLPGKSS